jgi:drug/metabolite transporter (DMT)-like permease
MSAAVGRERIGRLHWLGEPITVLKISGAAAVLAGVRLTRLGRKAAAAVPIEE